jgi:AraC-like DNA-binding protein/mannose-6-phosphate isomerase-like protein (cupin superfamily)
MADGSGSLREDRIHGTVSYPLAVYDNYNRYPQFSKQLLEIHWHDEMEFLYVDRGPMLFRLHERPFLVKPGQAIVIPPGVIHTAESVDGKPFMFQAVVFNLSLIDNDPTDTCHQKYFKHLRDQRLQLTTIINQNEPWGMKVIAGIRTICQLYFDKPGGFELGIKSALFDIFFTFFMADEMVKEDVSGSKHDVERFKIVFEHIQKNFAQRLTVEDLAEKINISKYYFIRMFKRITGRTPLDYLNHYRMQQAAKMLETDKFKIIDIAYEVGINDDSYFTKLFNKYFGCNPSHYRAQ